MTHRHNIMGILTALVVMSALWGGVAVAGPWAPAAITTAIEHFETRTQETSWHGGAMGESPVVRVVDGEDAMSIFRPKPVGEITEVEKAPSKNQPLPRPRQSQSDREKYGDQYGGDPYDTEAPISQFDKANEENKRLAIAYEKMMERRRLEAQQGGRKSRNFLKRIEDKVREAGRDIEDKTREAGRDIEDKTREAGRDIEDSAKKEEERIKKELEKVIKAVQNMLGKFRIGGGGNIFSGLEDIVKKPIEKIKEISEDAVDDVKDLASDFDDSVRKRTDRATQAIKRGVDMAIDNVQRRMDRVNDEFKRWEDDVNEFARYAEDKIKHELSSTESSIRRILESGDMGLILRQSLILYARVVIMYYIPGSDFNVLGTFDGAVLNFIAGAIGKSPRALLLALLTSVSGSSGDPDPLPPGRNQPTRTTQNSGTQTTQNSGSQTAQNSVTGTAQNSGSQTAQNSVTGTAQNLVVRVIEEDTQTQNAGQGPSSDLTNNPLTNVVGGPQVFADLFQQFTNSGFFPTFAGIGGTGLIRGQLAWTNTADLDLHLLFPGSSVSRRTSSSGDVYFSNKIQDFNGGRATAQLDTDNLGGRINFGEDLRVENIVVTGDEIPAGGYNFFVRNFSANGNAETFYVLRLTGDAAATSQEHVGVLVRSKENSEIFTVNSNGGTFAIQDEELPPDTTSATPDPSVLAAVPDPAP